MDSRYLILWAAIGLVIIGLLVYLTKDTTDLSGGEISVDSPETFRWLNNS